MNRIRRIAGIGAITALALLGASQNSYAQSSNTAAAKLDADTFKLPPHYDLDTNNSGKQSEGLSLPDKIDLGGSQLQFDTSRKDNIPHVGLDNSDTSPLKAGIPSRNDSQIPPVYFGFTLSKPTR